MTSTSGISITLLIFDPEDRVLTLRRKATGRWDLPSGSVPAQGSVPVQASRIMKEETGLPIPPAGWNKGFVYRQNGLMIVLWAKLNRDVKIVSRNGLSDKMNWSRLHDILQPCEPYVRDVIETLSGSRWNLAPMQKG